MKDANKRRPTTALVLGAGSARGLAHIGVIQVLIEEEIPIDLIVGSSMGAMVGGLYASGSDMHMLEKLVYCLNTSIFFDVQVPRLGFISGKNIESLLELLCKKKNFEDLDIPLYVTTTDLISGKAFVFDSGPVSRAIRASISIPGVFKPIRHNKMLLVDGAVSDRLPIKVAEEHGADIRIAVDVTFQKKQGDQINNLVDVFMASLDILERKVLDLSCQEADILIQPRLKNISSTDFDRVDELVEQGRIATKEQIPCIKEMINKKLNKNS